MLLKSHPVPLHRKSLAHYATDPEDFNALFLEEKATSDAAPYSVSQTAGHKGKAFPLG